MSVGAVVAAVTVALYFYGQTIWTASVPFIIAIVLAYILNPVAGWLQRRLCRGNRVLAVSLLYLLAVLVAVPGLLIVGTVVVGEAISLIGPSEAAAPLPAAADTVDVPLTSAESAAADPWYIRILPAPLTEALDSFSAEFKEGSLSISDIARIMVEELAAQSGVPRDEIHGLFMDAAGKAAQGGATGAAWVARQVAAGAKIGAGLFVGMAGGVVRLVFDTTMVVIILFYMLIDLNKLGQTILRYVPPIAQSESVRIWRMIDLQWSAFLRGQITVALSVGIMGAVLFPVAGVDFGILIGLVTGACNVVPYLGPAIGAGLAIGSTVLEQVPNGWGAVGWQLLKVLLVFWAIQMTDGFLITPFVMSGSVEMHPMLIFFGLILGGGIAGMVGMLLAVPFMCAVRVLVRELYLIPLQEYALEAGLPPPEAPEPQQLPGGTDVEDGAEE